MSLAPLAAAECRGVKPPVCARSGRAPASSRIRTTSPRERAAALPSGVTALSLADTAFTSAPRQRTDASCNFPFKRPPGRSNLLPRMGGAATAREGPKTVVAFQGELDAATCAQLDSEFAAALESDCEEIVLDLSGLAFLDSS